MTIGERIADARLGSELTVAQAARRIGVKAKTLRNWENGSTVPRANRLQMLAGVFNVSLIWLLEGRDDLDPLENLPNSFELLNQKLAHVRELHDELGKAIQEIEVEAERMRVMSEPQGLRAEQN